jgi:hypothetical protein
MQKSNGPSIMNTPEYDNNPISWDSLYRKYKGQWVALKDDEQTVISNASTAREALEKSKLKGFENPILTKMPINLDPFVG